MIDERDVEPRRLGGIRFPRIGRGGGEGENLDEPAAVDLAVLVVIDVLPLQGLSSSGPFLNIEYVVSEVVGVRCAQPGDQVVTG